jgi:hypothetical protein
MSDALTSVPGMLDLPGYGLCLLTIGSLVAGNPTYATLDGQIILSYADAMRLAAQRRRGRNPGLYPERRSACPLRSRRRARRVRRRRAVVRAICGVRGCLVVVRPAVRPLGGQRAPPNRARIWRIWRDLRGGRDAQTNRAPPGTCRVGRTTSHELYHG